MTTELVIVRVFDHPREVVFACLTRAGHLTHFWGPVPPLRSNTSRWTFDPAVCSRP